MKLIAIICLHILILLSACGPTWVEPTTIIGLGKTTYVCVDLPDLQQESAKKAIEAWNHSIRQWKNVVYVKNSSYNCSYWVHEVEEENLNDAHAIAWASSLGGHEISMRKGWYEHDTAGILMHELGHAFGAQHLSNTLMNPYWYKRGFICPDMSTVAQVAAWNKINLSLLSWCTN